MMIRPRVTPAAGIRLVRPVPGVRRSVSNTSNAPDTKPALDTSEVSKGKPRARLPFRRIDPFPARKSKPEKKEPAKSYTHFIDRVGAKQLMENSRKFGDKLEIEIEPTGDITLEMDPGTMKASLLWLRDVCPCPKCVDPHSGQKSFSLVDLPDRPQVRSAEKTEDGSLKVIWENDGVVPGGSLHESIYPRHKLVEWTNHYFTRQPQKLSTLRKPWNQPAYLSLLESGATRISYKHWTTDREAFHRAFTALAQTGLIFITDVPHGEQEVERIGNQIGMLQHTFYGSTWDVKSKPNAENVAYTSQFLGLHQDLMYHVPIPRLQLLHCLENSCEGGESLFSDGLHAALHLKTTNRQAYNYLNLRKWFFGYDKAPHHYEREHPVISSDKTGYIRSIHWAPPFQTPFLRTPTDIKPNLESLKAAATLFERELSSPENMLEVKLNPGEAIIFDNWRVLHGRREFAAGAGGSRWLKGAYISDQVFRALDERRPRGPDDYPVWPLPDAVQFRKQAAEDEMERFRALHGLELAPTGESEEGPRRRESDDGLEAAGSNSGSGSGWDA